MSDSEAVETVVPNRGVFVWRPIIRVAVIAVVLAVAAHLFLPLFAPAVDPGLFVWLLVAVPAVSLYAINRFVTFRRTSYEFHADRLVVKTGSIATRSTIDLPYRNVTQVVLRLPFIEHRLFETGHLSVHAAGSSQGFAHLESVDEPHRLYDKIADHLRDNGFSLARDERLQRETPHLVGTALDTSGAAIGGLVALITVGLTIGGGVIDLMELQSYYELFDVLFGTADGIDEEQADIAFRSTLGLAILAVFAGTFGLAKLAIYFVDLNRRTYTLWDDVVDYCDGFLTETYKFIPIENLADTSTKVPFLKRLFGMADVELSPHGSASGIRFPSMPRAAQFREHLDRLIELSDAPTPDTATAAPDGEAEVEGEETAVDRTARRSATEQRLPDVDAPPLDFGPSFVRRAITAVIESLKLPAMVLLMVAIGWGIVTYYEIDVDAFDLPLEELSVDLVVTGALFAVGGLLLWQLGKAGFFCATVSYRVGRRKFGWERDFISRDQLEFTADKITLVAVERDLVDRMMGTATITLRSIGNATPMVFEDVWKAQPKLDEIRRRLGMRADEESADTVEKPRLNPLDAVACRLYLLLVYGAIGVTAALFSIEWPWTIWIAAAFGVFALYRVVADHVYYPFCRMRLFDNHLGIRKGILFLQDYYIPYDQVRSVITTRYPGRSRGTIQFVPGSSLRVSLKYLDDLEELHERMDDRIYDRPMRPVEQPDELDRTEISRRTPVARNKILVAGVFTLSLTVITVVPTFLMYLAARRTTITVEQGRVRVDKGILYRSTQTVLSNRIDQLLTDRRPIHTLFGNGRVSVLTVGGTVPELKLGPVSDEEELYDEIEQRLPGK